MALCWEMRLKRLNIVLNEILSTKQGVLGAIHNCEAKRLCDLSGCVAGTSICVANSLGEMPAFPMVWLGSNSSSRTTHSLRSFGRSKRLKPSRLSPHHWGKTKRPSNWWSFCFGSECWGMSVKTIKYCFHRNSLHKVGRVTSWVYRSEVNRPYDWSGNVVWTSGRWRDAQLLWHRARTP